MKAICALLFFCIVGFTAQAAAPLADYHWKMNEGQGTTTTDSVASVVGTLVGAATWTAGYTSSNAIAFDGLSGRVTLPIVAGDSADSNLTYCFWFYPSNTVSGRYIISEGKFEVLYSSTSRLIVTSDGVQFPLTANNSITPNVWQFVAITRAQSGTVNVYVNDVNKLSGYSGVAQPGTQNTKLMCRASTTTLFADGMLDHVRVYHRILTSLELSDLYEEFHVVSNITAASCSLVDVQTAVNAACCGDTVIIPDCAANWTNTLTVYNKRIRVLGKQLLYPSSGRTSITNNAPLLENTAIITTLGSLPMTIGGLDFYYNASAYAYDTFQLNSSLFRITRCNFYEYRKRAIDINGDGIGLIDHCLIRQSAASDLTTQAIRIRGNSNDNPPAQTAGSAWDKGPTFGTTNRVIIENVTIDHAHVQDASVEGYSGSEYTVRYSIITNDAAGLHGNDSSLRAGKSSEIYSNVLAVTSGSELTTLFEYRGGTAIVCSNRVFSYSGSPQFGVDLSSYRSTYTNIFSSYVNFFLSVTNYLDGCSNEFGWPGLDQIGRTGPVVFNSTNVTQPPQMLCCWSNTFELPTVTNAFTARVARVYDDSAWPSPLYAANEHIIAGRDFTNGVNAIGWTPLIYPHPLNVDIQAIEVVPPAMTIGAGTTLGSGVTIR